MCLTNIIKTQRLSALVSQACSCTLLVHYLCACYSEQYRVTLSYFDCVNKGWLIPPLTGCLLTRDYCKYLSGTVDIKITLTNGYTSLDSEKHRWVCGSDGEKDGRGWKHGKGQVGRYMEKEMGNVWEREITEVTGKQNYNPASFL